MRKIRRDILSKVRKDNTFTGEDGVLVLDFLAKLVQAFDTQEMNEGQAIRLLPEFLSGIALRQYTSVSQTAGSHHGKVSVWPEAVQWLLRSFATDEAIRQAVLALREVQQRPSEDEMEFYIRLTDASNRCGNVYSMEEQMTMFIEGLDASIKPMVSQYRQDNRDVSFLRLVNYAKAHGSASRTKEKKTKKVTIQTPATLRVGNKPKVPHPVQFPGQKNAVRKGATKIITKELLSPMAILLRHRRATDMERTEGVGRQLYRRPRTRWSRTANPRTP